MQYSPKLKMAMEDIKAICNKYDIGAFVIIHTPGYTEFLNKLDPSYSCITVNGDEVHFRSKLDDYNGDKAAWEKKTTESVNLLDSITQVGGQILLPLLDFTEKLMNDLDAERDRGGFSSHTTQNN